MTDATPSYQPGDIANGHVLDQDLVWQPLTPVVLAELAAKRGDRFFQVEIPHSTLSGHSNDFGFGGDTSYTTRHGAAPDVLGQIEEIGWRLEHATWLFVETGSSSREKMFVSGAMTTVTGRVDGIYLFRSTRGG